MCCSNTCHWLQEKFPGVADPRTNDISCTEKATPKQSSIARSVFPQQRFSAGIGASGMAVPLERAQWSLCSRHNIPHWPHQQVLFSEHYNALQGAKPTSHCLKPLPEAKSNQELVWLCELEMLAQSLVLHVPQTWGALMGEVQCALLPTSALHCPYLGCSGQPLGFGLKQSRSEVCCCPCSCLLAMLGAEVGKKVW